MNRYLQIATIVFLVTTQATYASQPQPPAELVRDCLGCHMEQRLPDNLIYRRYLLRYSSPKRIEAALLSYLKHPDKANSIMPSEFFLRFPMKEKPNFDDEQLQKAVEDYMKFFDVKKEIEAQNPNPKIDIALILGWYHIPRK